MSRGHTSETVTPVTEGPVPLLEVEAIKKHYPVRSVFGRGQAVRAVDGVSFAIPAGTTFGLVGESGCGKSTTGRLVLGLEPLSSGAVRFEGQDVSSLGGSALKEFRRRAQIVFQDPYSSLNPRMKVEEIVGEPFRVHHAAPRGTLSSRVPKLLDQVGLPPEAAQRFPHEFSGGQRQRIAIARAIALRPRLVVCDEPLSALDVSVQSQIINLFRDLQRELGLAYLFISHDLSVVRHLSDPVGVMYLGRLVELGGAEDVFTEPLHPYTQVLMSAIPIADPVRQRSRQRLPMRGDVPSPQAPPSGCPFHPRCPYAVERCVTDVPEWRQLRPGHWAACHLAPIGQPETVAPTAIPDGRRV